MSDVPPQVHELLHRAGVVIAYLFGSRARSEAGRGSDVDVAVLCDRDLDLRERARLANALAELLGAPRADLVVLDEAPLELRGRVVQEGGLLHSTDEPRRVAFETRTRSEWFDFEPTLRELTNAYLRRIAKQGL